MIYLDNAATTRICNASRIAMEPYLKEKYGNPSGAYGMAQDVRRQVEKSRKVIAESINCEPENIFFTSGGTESDNWVLDNYGYEGNHIITSVIEHHAVLNKCSQLKRNGTKITLVNVDDYGMINWRMLEGSIRRDTKLISVMMANNEIGTIQPVEQIGQLAHEYNIDFHTDAVQAVGHIPIDVKKMNIDMLSASSHKFNGPKGVGFLYVKNPEGFNSLIYGGGQEAGKRAGTENVAGIIGMSVALREAVKNMRERMRKETEMRNYLIKNILGQIPYVRLNGHPSKRLPGNVNLTFAGINGASLVVLMDSDDICISSGSACSANSESPSHVINAIGVQGERAYGTIRISLSSENTMEELNYTIRKLKEHVYNLRRKR